MGWLAGTGLGIGLPFKPFKLTWRLLAFALASRGYAEPNAIVDMDHASESRELRAGVDDVWRRKHALTAETFGFGPW